MKPKGPNFTYFLDNDKATAAQLKARLQAIAASVGALGRYNREPSISALLRLIAEGELVVTRKRDYEEFVNSDDNA